MLLRIREIKTLIHCWREYKNGTTTLENSLAVPQKVKELLLDLPILLLGVNPEELKTHATQ